MGVLQVGPPRPREVLSSWAARLVSGAADVTPQPRVARGRSFAWGSSFRFPALATEGARLPMPFVQNVPDAHGGRLMRSVGTSVLTDRSAWNRVAPCSVRRAGLIFFKSL